jgi:hypothetical protein
VLTVHAVDGMHDVAEVAVAEVGHDLCLRLSHRSAQPAPVGRGSDCLTLRVAR